jgi:hypothetical protein
MHAKKEQGTPAAARVPGNARRDQADVLILVAVCSTSAMFVCLAWILASSAGVVMKMCSVMICLGIVAIGTLVIGYLRLEFSRLRHTFDITETRLRLDADLDPADDFERSEVVDLPLGLKLFLQGRDAAYRDDPPLGDDPL